MNVEKYIINVLYLTKDNYLFSVVIIENITVFSYKEIIYMFQWLALASVPTTNMWLLGGKYTYTYVCI